MKTEKVYTIDLSAQEKNSPLTSLLPVTVIWQYAKCGATRMNEINMKNNLDLTHGSL